MKKILSVFLAVCMCVLALSCLGTAVYAEQYGDFKYYENDGEITIAGYNGSDTDIVIPAEINGYPVKVISTLLSDERRTEISSVTIPEGIENISADAFWGFSGLTSISLPTSVMYIQNNAFTRCTGIKSITISDNVISVGSSAFALCTGLENVTILGSDTSFEPGVFAGCTGLKNINFPKGGLSQCPTMFMDCTGLESVTVPDVRGYANGAFERCTSLKEVEFTDGAKKIDKEMFMDCTGLTSITIPRRTFTIYENAFNGCSNLKNVRFNGTEQEFNDMISLNDMYSDGVFSKAEKIFYADVKILDRMGKTLSEKVQNMGEAVDVSAITVPAGRVMTLYENQASPVLFSQSTPISKNLELFCEFAQPEKLSVYTNDEADIGEKSFRARVSFATSKTAKELIAQFKYSDKLSLSQIKSNQFTILRQSSETRGGYTYLTVSCSYKGDGDMEKNTVLLPFDLLFDVSEEAVANEVLTVEAVGEESFLAASGGATHDFTGFENSEVKIKAMPVSDISISGANETDEPTKYTASVAPSYATDKRIEWSVDNSDVAEISEDGTLTPKKTGTVKIRATAKDGSGIYKEKSVNVTVYAKVTSLVSETGIWDKAFASDVKDYTIYVPKSATLIKLTPQHSGTLSDGSLVLYSGRKNSVPLANDETVLTLTCSNDGYTDTVYTIRIIKICGTKTTISEDDKTITVNPMYIDEDCTVILALYNGDSLAEMQAKTYSGEELSFATDKEYTGARVMVWDSLSGMTPVCDAEIVR